MLFRVSDVASKVAIVFFRVVTLRQQPLIAIESPRFVPCARCASSMVMTEVSPVGRIEIILLTCSTIPVNINIVYPNSVEGQEKRNFKLKSV